MFVVHFGLEVGGRIDDRIPREHTTELGRARGPYRHQPAIRQHALELGRQQAIVSDLMHQADIRIIRVHDDFQRVTQLAITFGCLRLGNAVPNHGGVFDLEGLSVKHWHSLISF
ncbi:hypothetical protein D3C73_1191650 [compost metagenome]